MLFFFHAMSPPAYIENEVIVIAAQRLEHLTSQSIRASQEAAICPRLRKRLREPSELATVEDERLPAAMDDDGMELLAR